MPPPFFGVPTVLFTMLTIPLFLYFVYTLSCIYIACSSLFFLYLYIQRRTRPLVSAIFLLFFTIFVGVCAGDTSIFPLLPPQYPQKQYFSTSKICEKPQGNPYSQPPKLTYRSLSQRYRNAIVNEKIKLPLDKLVKVWYTTL